MYFTVNSFKTASGISIKGDSSSVAAQAMFKTIRRYSGAIPHATIHMIIKKPGWIPAITGIWIFPGNRTFYCSCNASRHILIRHKFDKAPLLSPYFRRSYRPDPLLGNLIIQVNCSRTILNAGKNQTVNASGSLSTHLHSSSSGIHWSDSISISSGRRVKQEFTGR